MPFLTSRASSTRHCCRRICRKRRKRRKSPLKKTGSLGIGGIGLRYREEIGGRRALGGHRTAGGPRAFGGVSREKKKSATIGCFLFISANAVFDVANVLGFIVRDDKIRNSNYHQRVVGHDSHMNTVYFLFCFSFWIELLYRDWWWIFLRFFY